MIRNVSAAIIAAAAATLCVDVPAYPQPVPGGLCRPVQERKSEVGCWIVEHKPLGQFQGPASWYLHVFPERSTADAAKGARGTVLEAFGKVWLFTVEEAGWKGPAGGSLHVEIAPLPVAAGSDYSAQFMEAVFTPGMASAVHVHSGPEAFYTHEGETCLETPAGKQVSRGGGPPIIIPDGPMHLTASGTALRRGFSSCTAPASRQPRASITGRRGDGVRTDDGARRGLPQHRASCARDDRRTVHVRVVGCGE